ncbi:MAG: DUF1822 family protein [Nostocaceae cyanobacterium]|nr:DUF1822 family protein [Nostocaceae cyanobacterium]
MTNNQVYANNFRLLFSEVVLLEPEYYHQAQGISQHIKCEAKKWQAYLNSLALSGFAEWLSEHLPDKGLSPDTSMIETVGNLKIGDFKCCLIATENILDEVVNVPRVIIDKSELTPHFYVVVEVLEEQEEIIIRGCLRGDQLVDYCRRPNFKIQSECYQLPLYLFDNEPNHLLFYSRFLEPSSILLPVTVPEVTVVPEKEIKETRTKLSQWLEGAIDAAWLSLDALMNPQVNFAFRNRIHIGNSDEGIKRGKLIDLQMGLGSQTVAMLVNIREAEDKLRVVIQLHPTGSDRFLPPNIKLSLLSSAGKNLQEVTSRVKDNYIQLHPFQGEIGTDFSVEVSSGDLKVREDFQL